MESPPDLVIGTAATYALNSTCAKSKRGVVIFSGRHILGVGTNGPPAVVNWPGGEQIGVFKCDGDRCRSYCREVAVHAEERAVRSMGHAGAGMETHLVHVKVDPTRGTNEPISKVVAGGGPSCVTCSRTILDAGTVTYVWLLEAQRWHTECRCQSCGKVTIIPQGGGTTGVCSDCPAFPGTKVGGLLDRGKTVYDPDSGIWKRYTAEEFHRTTLWNLGLYGGKR